MKPVAFSLAAAASLALSALSAKAENVSDSIQRTAAQSSCARIVWKSRGVAPRAYMRGVALVFARSACNLNREDVRIVAARADEGPQAQTSDGLRWAETEIRGAGLTPAASGVDSLRQSYVLLLGLGMMESSGQHCVGRDKSADFSSAETAEAGLFQTSWGARSKAAPELENLFGAYRRNEHACHLDVFSRGVRCGAWDARTWGSGDGAVWQKLSKSCPAFATEYGAVVMRRSGGGKGEFGPLRKHKVEIRSECDAMLKQVQAIVEKPGACDALK